MIIIDNVNLLAIGLAALLAWISGAIWYHEKMFGSLWKAQQPRRDKSDFEKLFTAALISSFIEAILLSWLFALIGLAAGIIGVLSLIIFLLVSRYANNVFKGGTTILWIIDAGYLTLQFAIIWIVQALMGA